MRNITLCRLITTTGCISSVRTVLVKIQRTLQILWVFFLTLVTVLRLEGLGTGAGLGSRRPQNILGPELSEQPDLLEDVLAHCRGHGLGAFFQPKLFYYSIMVCGEHILCSNLH